MYWLFWNTTFQHLTDVLLAIHMPPNLKENKSVEPIKYKGVAVATIK